MPAQAPPETHRSRSEEQAPPETHLFLAGCPRSGTSAVTFLLNEHPQIALGFERFKRTRAQLEPFHFAPAQFFSPVLAETDIRGELLYRRLHERWCGGAVTVIGDKVPLYWRVLPELLERFPRGRFVLLVRDPHDVAASFDRRARDPEDWWPTENDRSLAVKMWCEALARVRDAEREGHGERLFLLPYEPLLAGEERWLHALLAFIGLSSTARVRSEHERLVKRWSARRSEPAEPGLASYIEAHRDPALEEWARARMEGQLERSLALEASVSRLVGPTGKEDEVLLAKTQLEEDETLLAQARLDKDEAPSVQARLDQDEAPLLAAQLGERAREQEELLEAMRRPGARGADEVEVLERRLLEQGKELLRRGERLRRVPPPAPELRVTFILPHQRQTTGGVYVIEQFARHLATQGLAVALAVRAGGETPRPVPGVEVRCAERLAPDALPAGDVLVYPADMRDAPLLRDLPAAAGRPVMLFQGYGTPGSPVVEANLAAADASVAIAHWLVDVALSYGTPCAYVPQGLDCAIFHSTSPKRSPRRVSLMTHSLDWKGLADALEALALVRRARPDVEVVAFGTEPVEDVDSFLERPTRSEVAALLRSSAVHIVSSWEEGFGLTGAEALACGAALASTDTKGSRDYAFPETTALVSPPRDPAALAHNVLRLLEDPGLRQRLVATGQHQLRTVMPPWPEAARRMALAFGAFAA
jgi:glycosyltransferase involved in cell wall biosynthesis